VTFVTDEDHRFAPFDALGRDQLLGLGNERGAVEPGHAAERGDDRSVDSAEADPRGAQVNRRVTRGVERRGRGSGRYGLARAALAGDDPDHLLRDAVGDPRGRLSMPAVGMKRLGRDVFPERRPGETVFSELG